VLFLISTRTAPDPISQVRPGCRVRHPQYSKKLFVRLCQPCLPRNRRALWCKTHWYVRIYVYIYIYIYVYIYIFIYIYIYIYIDIYIYIYTEREREIEIGRVYLINMHIENIHKHAQIHVRYSISCQTCQPRNRRTLWCKTVVCVHIYICVYICTYIYTYYVYIICVCIHIYINIYKYCTLFQVISNSSTPQSPRTRMSGTCVCIYIHTCMYVCMYIHTCLIYVHIYIHVCIYVYIHTCMYICIYMYVCMYICQAYTYTCTNTCTLCHIMSNASALQSPRIVM